MIRPRKIPAQAGFEPGIFRSQGGCLTTRSTRRSGTTWEASQKTLKTDYQGTVRLHLEHGCTAWLTTEKTNQQVLDKVQSQELHLITGAMRSTPITEMERLTGVQPLGQDPDASRCMPNHPMKTRLEGLTKNRLKRNSFVQESKKLTPQF